MDVISSTVAARHTNPGEAQAPAAGHTSRLQWQETLFSSRLDRAALMRLKADWPCKRATLNVHRNHAFEPLMRPLATYLAFAGWEFACRIGNYDDTLSAIAYEPADIDLVWLDYAHYDEATTGKSIADWLLLRIEELFARGAKQIVVTNWAGGGVRGADFNVCLDAAAQRLPGLYVTDLNALSVEAGARFWDTARSVVTGTRLSDVALLMAARRLGSGTFPSLVATNIKALAVDLDNTLYDGVLGEDGVDGVTLSPERKALQDMLVELTDKGVFLVCVSRNQPEDVRELFERRSDFPLKKEHFVDWHVGWSEKSDAIRRAAIRLRISTNSFLFLDDNPGELMSVGYELPGVRLLFAKTADVSLRGLKDFPGLWPLKAGNTDRVRIADMQANAGREILAASVTDPIEYVRALGVQLHVRLRPIDEAGRLHDMSRKTNQFNLALARLEPNDVALYLSDAERSVATVALKDRLSDSGIIAASFGRRVGDVLMIDELCISCRAMGRHLEDAIVTAAVGSMARDMGVSRAAFTYKTGPRNQPAREWLAFFSEKTLGPEGEIVLEWMEKMGAVMMRWPIEVRRE